MTVRIHAPTGDPSFLPPNRRYLLQVRGDRPVSVRVEGAGELPGLADARGTSPGWWEDGHGFTWVRLPSQPASVITLTT